MSGDNAEAVPVPIPIGTSGSASSTQGVSNGAKTFEDKLRKKYLEGSLPPKDLLVSVIGQGLSKFRIHKDLFMMASKEFSDILSRADDTGDGSYEVSLNMNPAVFKFVKHFLYTDDLPLQICYPNQNTIIPLDLRMKLKILEASFQFEIDRLFPKVLELIKDGLEMEVAFSVLQASREMGVDELKSIALKLIWEHAEKLLTLHLEAFSALGLHDASCILSSDELRCGEVTVFRAALSWAKDKVSRASPKMIKDAKKYYFQQIAECVRFPLMTPAELAQVSLEDKVLEDDELVKLFQYVCLPDSRKQEINPNFNITRRCHVKYRPTFAPPPPPPDLAGYKPHLVAASRKRRISDDNSTVISTTTTTTSAPKTVRFSSIHHDDSSDEDLFVEIRQVNGREFQSYEDLTRRYFREESPGNIGSVRFNEISFNHLYRPVIFKSCKDFVLDAKFDFIKVQDNNAGTGKQTESFKQFLKCFDPMRYLTFITKEFTRPLRPADIWSLNQNILLNFNLVTFLKIQHAQSNPTKEISDTLVLNYIRNSGEILNNDQVKPTTLAISNCPFSSGWAKGKQKIKTLILYKVWGDFTGKDITADYPELNELVLWKHSPNSTSSCAKASNDLLFKPICLTFSKEFAARNTLRKLVLFQCTVDLPLRFMNQATTIAELELDHCELFKKGGVGRNVDAAQVFHLIFPKLQKLLLIEDVNPGNYSGDFAKSDLINCVCNNIESIKWVMVMGLKWGWRIGASYEEIEDQKLERFLSTVDVCHGSTDFLLERTAKKWTGKDYNASKNEPVAVDGGYHTMRDQLEYDWYGLKHFYENCDVYEEYFLNACDDFPEPVFWV